MRTLTPWSMRMALPWRLIVWLTRSLSSRNSTTLTEASGGAPGSACSGRSTRSK